MRHSEEAAQRRNISFRYNIIKVILESDSLVAKKHRYLQDIYFRMLYKKFPPLGGISSRIFLNS